MTHASKTIFDSLFEDGAIPFSMADAATVVPPLTVGAAAGPVIVGAGPSAAMALYLTERGTSSAISVSDINQGQIGDCFLLSAIGEIALDKPSDITSMIKSNANGTETVTLYEAANGGLPTFGTTAYKPVQINVANVFPSNSVNDGTSQDVVNGTKEIWVQVLEKAVATLDGGYSAIANGGSPVIAMEELTGRQATWMSPSSMSAATLTSLSKAGDLMIFDTPNSGSLPYNLVGNHAYMFEGISTVNGVATVTLGNPWGFDQPAEIPVSQLAKAFVEIDVGKPA